MWIKSKGRFYFSRKKTCLNDIVSRVLGGCLNSKVSSDIFLILFATKTIYYMHTSVLLESKHFTAIRYRLSTARLSTGNPHVYLCIPPCLKIRYRWKLIDYIKIIYHLITLAYIHPYLFCSRSKILTFAYLFVCNCFCLCFSEYNLCGFWNLHHAPVYKKKFSRSFLFPKLKKY